MTLRVERLAVPLIAALRSLPWRDRTSQAAGEQTRRIRRRSAVCSAGAAAILGVVTTYQTGIVASLPEPAARWFDSSLVMGSGEAYWIGSTADAPIGVANYAVTVALATRPALTRLWRAKLALDAAYSVVLAVEQPLLYRRVCVYCLSVTALSLAALATGRVVPGSR